MIKILIPQALVENLREFLYNHQKVVFDIYDKNLEKKLKENYWDIVYIEEKKIVPGKIVVSSFKELELAVMYLEEKIKYDMLKMEHDMLFAFPELQGPIVREFLERLVKEGKKTDRLKLKYEDGMYLNEYSSYLKIKLPGVKISFSKNTGIKIPPLRERKEDIAFIFDKVLSSIYQKHASLPKRIPSDDEYELLRLYNWPGNTRELVKVTSEYVTRGILDIPRFKKDTFSGIDLGNFTSKLVKHVEKRYISLALEKASSRMKAAEMLNLNYKTLSHKIRLYKLDKK
ncbi:Fis family transcriptional regulator [Thermosipho melanesiensis]|uniref:Transcriptional regulator, Fis family n=2 Tax=Thermosipho melanesiensis TaxID=46541 RepID=A6LPA7_THEM4|nr:helix-turn-helix domain-containing protein [Thermosipho melanesiensis]ABR31758.1 transcriptional regulator, Fis family [Thermosipho melanesiensis BI429]APT74780.1 Fis family transcriptional regulator [Thermosipho melanesiensis]OOC35103.1 Fis family transcriptional regulator [Thermosipho melanesiensis]OOC35139.1 Fis family transcriptional regulator [Thermosipho melanesiensis]OOC36824.1 Fis family transcriptional regulator [Thermosipho melanesiensis]